MSEEYKAYLKVLSELDNNQDRYKSIKETHDRYNKSVEEIESDFTIYLEQELREKVHGMTSVDSLFRQKIIKTQILEWLKRFINSNKDAESLIEAYAIQECEAETYTIAELLEMAKSVSSGYIVKGLLPLGDLFLLVAAPKVGKSLFATSLAVNVATGRPFLNRETEIGNVLYIQNEERIQSTTINRIYTHGLQVLELQQPELYQELINSRKLLVSRNYDLVLDQAKLVKQVIDDNIKLVIIDSLGASIRRSGLTEYSPELVTALYKFQNECQTHNFSSLILHHATKMDSDENRQKMMGGVAGTNGISRANGGIFRLFPDKGDGNTISLRTIPREGDPVSLNLQLKKEEACYWFYDVTKESALSVENIELQNQILRLLYGRYHQWEAEHKHDEEEIITEEQIIDGSYPPVYGYTLSELIELTDSPREEVVKRLNDMRTTEAITCIPSSGIRAFVYAIHCSGTSWMDVYLEQDAEKQREEEERKRIEELYLIQINKIADDLKLLINNDSSKEEISSFLTKLSIQEKKDVDNRLSEEEQNKLLLIFYPPKYSIGNSMLIKEENSIAIIERIEVMKDAKPKYHNYFLEGYIKPYIESQIELHEIENDSTSTS